MHNGRVERKILNQES